MTSDIRNVLKKLELKDTGTYKDHFYIINIDNSDEYAKMYTKLEKNAINTEFPNIGQNSSRNTVKITHYFEIDIDNITYTLFLIADFDNDKYYLKIGENILGANN